MISSNRAYKLLYSVRLLMMCCEPQNVALAKAEAHQRKWASDSEWNWIVPLHSCMPEVADSMRPTNV